MRTSKKRVTYKQAQSQVDRLAKGLLSIGLKRGDKVAVFMTNNLEWVYCHLAVAKAGAVLVCINTHFKSEELEYSLRRSDVSTFKRIYVGGAPVTRDLFELMRDKMGMDVVLSPR